MKKNLIIVIIILIVIILGLCTFIVYDKDLLGFKEDGKNIVEEKDNTSLVKQIDINSDLVKNLVYPNGNPNFGNYAKGFVLEDVNVSNYSRNDKMIMAQFYDMYLNYNNIYNYSDDNYIWSLNKMEKWKLLL